MGRDSALFSLNMQELLDQMKVDNGRISFEAFARTMKENGDLVALCSMELQPYDPKKEHSIIEASGVHIPLLSGLSRDGDHKRCCCCTIS